MDALTKLAIKYKTDKWGKHNYTPIYYEMFKDRRESVKKVLEIGAGEGASLFMWQDFFPNAKIFSLEIDPNRCFVSNRIRIIQGDQASKKDLLALIEKIGSDIDLVIDDGSHKPIDQINTCLSLLPELEESGVYIIEDVASKKLGETLIKELIKENKGIWYQQETFKVGKRYDDRLIVIKKGRIGF